MMNHRWPNALQAPSADRVAFLLAEFWRVLQRLPDLLQRHEHLLADLHTAQLRTLVIEMMLALNGIQWPPDTLYLNHYLGESQRAALQKTLILPAVSSEDWIGRAVALVVIYRWYAPQLVEKLALAYPQALEDATLALVQRELADWPLAITTG
jgi:hypothetical protein